MPPRTKYILPFSAILGPIQWDLVEEIRRAHAEEPPLAACLPSNLYVPTSLCFH